MSKKDYRELDRAIISCTPPPPTPKKLTAYEELKAWCEKHLAPDEYMASNSRIISINSTDFYFDSDGSLNFID